jgi:hypothetical protein
MKQYLVEMRIGWASVKLLVWADDAFAAEVVGIDLAKVLDAAYIGVEEHVQDQDV